MGGASSLWTGCMRRRSKGTRRARQRRMMRAVERPTALLRLLYEKSPEAVVETLAAERCLTDPALERRQEAITIVRQAMAKHVPNRPGGSPWFAATDALSAAGFLNQRAMELHASDAAVARQQRTMQTFADFWPFYLREHSRPGTRALHLVGTSLSLLLVIFAAALHRPALLLAAVICGYAFAWVG